MNTIYKSRVTPSYQKMYEQALDIHSINHPVQKMIEKTLCTLTFSATIVEDKQTLSVLKNISGGVVAFLCTLKANGKVISEGRSVTVLNGNNKYVSKNIQFARSSSLLDAVAKMSKYLEVLDLDTNPQPNSGIKLDESYQVKKEVENPDSITDKQKKYLIQLIHQNCADEKEKESLVSELDGMSSIEASDQIKSFIEA